MRMLLSGALAAALSSLATAQISGYTQDFEGLNQADPAALTNDGWLVYGNVFDSGGGYIYGYGPFPAPNGGPGFCGITNNQGGTPQGAQQLVIYSDYNNGDHANGNLVEGNTFQEQIVDATDVGKTFTFTFDAKLGDIQPNSTTLAFIKLIDNNTFGLSAFVTEDTTNIPTTWSTFSLSHTIDASQVGHFFQVGFLATSTLYTPSGIVYDNIVLAEDSGSGGVGTNYCLSTVNSTGAASTISATGSASIAANDLVLTADNLPSQPGIFIAGGATAQVPFFNGFLCIAPSGLQRFTTVTFPAGGTTTQAVDIATSVGGGLNVSAGSPYHYQRWNRDPAGGGGNANFSDGLEVMYTP